MGLTISSITQLLYKETSLGNRSSLNAEPLSCVDNKITAGLLTFSYLTLDLSKVQMTSFQNHFLASIGFDLHSTAKLFVLAGIFRSDIAMTKQALNL